MENVDKKDVLEEGKSEQAGVQRHDEAALLQEDSFNAVLWWNAFHLVWAIRKESMEGCYKFHTGRGFKATLARKNPKFLLYR